MTARWPSLLVAILLAARSGVAQAAIAPRPAGPRRIQRRPERGARHPRDRQRSGQAAPAGSETDQCSHGATTGGAGVDRAWLRPAQGGADSWAWRMGLWLTPSEWRQSCRTAAFDRVHRRIELE